MPDESIPPLPPAPRPRRLRRVIARSSRASHLSESIEVLRLLSFAAACITRTAPTQKYLDRRGWGSSDVLHTTLAETHQEFGKEGQKIYSFRFVSRNESPILRCSTVFSIRPG